VGISEFLVSRILFLQTDELDGEYESRVGGDDVAKAT
jgi:hypothetical protein